MVIRISDTELATILKGLEAIDSIRDARVLAYRLRTQKARRHYRRNEVSELVPRPDRGGQWYFTYVEDGRPRKKSTMTTDRAQAEQVRASFIAAIEAEGDTSDDRGEQESEVLDGDRVLP